MMFSVAQNVTDEDCEFISLCSSSLPNFILTPRVIVRMKVEVEEMSKVRRRSEQVLGLIPASHAADCASADLAVVMN